MSGDRAPSRASEIEALAQEQSFEAVQALMAIIRDPDSRDDDALLAIDVILRGAYGEPPEAFDLDDEDVDGEEAEPFADDRQVD